jgi:hypothetical protein
MSDKADMTPVRKGGNVVLSSGRIFRAEGHGGLSLSRFGESILDALLRCWMARYHNKISDAYHAAKLTCDVLS